VDCLKKKAEAVDPCVDEQAPEVILEGCRVLQPEDVSVSVTGTYSFLRSGRFLWKMPFFKCLNTYRRTRAFVVKYT
jgi:hypothetical protein